MSPDELNIDWGDNKGAFVGSPAAIEMLTDWFSTRSTRKVDFVKGIYRFDFAADDGGTLIVRDESLTPDKQVILDQTCVLSLCSYEVPLEEKAYTIQVRHWEGEGDARICLRWEPVEANQPPPTCPATE